MLRKSVFLCAALALKSADKKRKQRLVSKTIGRKEVIFSTRQGNHRSPHHEKKRTKSSAHAPIAAPERHARGEALPRGRSNGLPPPLPSLMDSGSVAPEDVDAAAEEVLVAASELSELESAAVVVAAAAVVVSAAEVDVSSVEDAVVEVVDAAVVVVASAVVLVPAMMVVPGSVVVASVDVSRVLVVFSVLLCDVEVVDEWPPLPMVVAAMLEQSVSGPFPSRKTPMMDVSATSSSAQYDLTCDAMVSRPLMHATEQFSPVWRSSAVQSLISRL